MIFNSIIFLLFSVAFFVLWRFMKKGNNSRWILIVLASFIFYGWWDWRFLFLIIFSGLVDYLAGILMIKWIKQKKLILAFSLIANLGSLLIFKYSTFFATVFQDFFALFNVKIDLISQIPEFALILPVGISFYTFQSLSYTIDIYKDRLKPTKNILHFFSYLAMFPQLVAGPIVRAKDFLKQLKSYRVPNHLEKWNAMKMICYGLFQKVVIADNLSFLIDSAYEGKALYSGTAFWWTVAIAFSFQIYADFSGYSLIARGLAKMMGYHFRINFNHPYLSTSIKQFWTKWHISLSTWFRDYVYIPLGGSRRSVVFGMVALCITMFASGIWHGANYTFVVWAGLHILYLLFERLTKWNKKIVKLPMLLISIVFVQVTIAWVYFRAESVQQANSILKNMFTLESTEIGYLKYYFNNVLFLFIAILIELTIFLRKKNVKISKFYKARQDWIDIPLVAISIVAAIYFRGEGQQFIYFQF